MVGKVVNVQAWKKESAVSGWMSLNLYSICMEIHTAHITSDLGFLFRLLSCRSSPKLLHKIGNEKPGFEASCNSICTKLWPVACAALIVSVVK